MTIIISSIFMIFQTDDLQFLEYKNKKRFQSYIIYINARPIM